MDYLLCRQMQVTFVRSVENGIENAQHKWPDEAASIQVPIPIIVVLLENQALTVGMQQLRVGAGDMKVQ